MDQYIVPIVIVLVAGLFGSALRVTHMFVRYHDEESLLFLDDAPPVWKEWPKALGRALPQFFIGAVVAFAIWVYSVVLSDDIGVAVTAIVSSYGSLHIIATYDRFQRVSSRNEELNRRLLNENDIMPLEIDEEPPAE